MQRPVSGHDHRMTPAGHFVDDGLAIDRDEARGAGVRQHRGIGRRVTALPLPQQQAFGLDDGTVVSRKCDAGLERSDHRFPASIFC
jgi:hypothetical protein